MNLFRIDYSNKFTYEYLNNFMTMESSPWFVRWDENMMKKIIRFEITTLFFFEGRDFKEVQLYLEALE